MQYNTGQHRCARERDAKLTQEEWNGKKDGEESPSFLLLAGCRLQPFGQAGQGFTDFAAGFPMVKFGGVQMFGLPA